VAKYYLPSLGRLPLVLSSLHILKYSGRFATSVLDTLPSKNITNTDLKQSRPKSILKGSMRASGAHSHSAPTQGVGDWRALKAAGVHVVKEKDSCEDN